MNAEGKPIRILVSDPQAEIRRVLTAMLSAQMDMRVIGEAVNGVETVRLARASEPDVVLLDTRVEGCATINRLLAECPDTQVVVFSSFDTLELVLETLCSGANAYLLKEASERERLETVREVAQGNSVLAPSIVRELLDEFRRIRPLSSDDERQIEALTEPERRTLDLVMKGHNNAEIADTIYRAEGTVKNYISSLMKKLDVDSRTELAIKAIRITATRPLAVRNRGKPNSWDRECCRRL